MLPAPGAVPEETTLRLKTFGRTSEVRIVKVPLGGRAAKVSAALESAAERLVAWLPSMTAVSTQLRHASP